MKITSGLRGLFLGKSEVWAASGIGGRLISSSLPKRGKSSKKI